jgi:hypothetical protein
MAEEFEDALDLDLEGQESQEGDDDMVFLPEYNMMVSKSQIQSQSQLEGSEADAPADDPEEESEAPSESSEATTENEYASQFLKWAQENEFDLSPEEAAEIDSPEKAKEKAAQLYAINFLEKQDPVLASALKHGIPVQEHLQYVNQVQAFLQQSDDQLAYSHVRDRVFKNMLEMGDLPYREDQKYTEQELQLFQSEVDKRMKQLDATKKQQIAQSVRASTEKSYQEYLQNYSKESEARQQKQIELYEKKYLQSTEETIAEYSKLKTYPIANVDHKAFVEYARQQLIGKDKDGKPSVNEAAFWKDLREGKNLREILFYKYLADQKLLEKVKKEVGNEVRKKLNLTPKIGKNEERQDKSANIWEKAFWEKKK